MGFKCPHCLVTFHDSWQRIPVLPNNSWDPDFVFGVERTQCASCQRAVLYILKRYPEAPYFRREKMIWPRSSGRAPLPKEVPAPYAKDHNEACAVLDDSANASAALSRRCLQALLRDKAATKERDLAKQIEEVINANALPSHLSEAIDSVRAIGNFAAHPMKSTNTGEILDAEPGEAEWLLDTLEGLFDFYFVQPAQLQAKKDALNAKLAEVKKPPVR